MNTVTEDKIDTKGSISIKESKRKEKVLRQSMQGQNRQFQEEHIQRNEHLADTKYENNQWCLDITYVNQILTVA